MLMMTRLQQCNATWPYQNLEQWLLDTLEASARRLGTHLARTRFPFAIVRNDSREPSARDFCRTPVSPHGLQPSWSSHASLLIGSDPTFESLVWKGYAVSKQQCMVMAYPESAQERAKLAGTSASKLDDRRPAPDAPACNVTLREAVNGVNAVNAVQPVPRGTSSIWASGGCRGAFACNGQRTGLCGTKGSTRRVLCSCAENATRRSALSALLNQHSAFIGSQATKTEAGRVCNVSLLQEVSSAAPCILGQSFGCVDRITAASASAACFAIELAGQTRVET